jgi:hypothetical protein
VDHDDRRRDIEEMSTLPRDIRGEVSIESLILSFLLFSLIGGLISSSIIYLIIKPTISDNQAKIITTIISCLFGIISTIIKSKKD